MQKYELISCNMDSFDSRERTKRTVLIKCDCTVCCVCSDECWGAKCIRQKSSNILALANVAHFFSIYTFRVVR